MLDGFNTQQEQRRHYPHSAETVFTALVNVVTRDFSDSVVDELTSTVTFSSQHSGWTWGENITASVLAVDDECDVVLTGVGKVGGQIQQASVLNATFSSLFASLSAELSKRPPM